MAKLGRAIPTRMSGSTEPFRAVLYDADGALITTLSTGTLVFSLVRISDETAVINGVSPTGVEDATGRAWYTPTTGQVTVTADTEFYGYWSFTPSGGSILVSPPMPHRIEAVLG